MGSAKSVFVAVSLVLFSGVSVVNAQEEAQQPVLIYDYAVNHPVEDAQFNGVPSIGASVPQTVEIATAEDRADPYYGYFYHQGRPIIVDLTTRSVVRIGN